MNWIKKLHHPNTYLILAWANFILFMVTILPWVSGLSQEAGLTQSIDTNFSFDPSTIYPIVASYGADGRLFYLIQRWTFDLIWPLVYAWPLFVTLRKYPIGWIAFLPWLATGFDYAENISFSVIVGLYPYEFEWIVLLGITMSLIKWIALGLSMIFSIIVPIAYLLNRNKR
jgi:hypothetical protein